MLNMIVLLTIVDRVLLGVGMARTLPFLHDHRLVRDA